MEKTRFFRGEKPRGKRAFLYAIVFLELKVGDMNSKIKGKNVVCLPDKEKPAARRALWEIQKNICRQWELR